MQDFFVELSRTAPAIINLDHVRAKSRGLLVWTLSRGAYNPARDTYSVWDKAIECGRSSLVGTNVPLNTFIRQHCSQLNQWQQLAYLFVRQNPGLTLILRDKRQYWMVYERGEYVEFNLPHQDLGGEKTYISRDGKSKIKINQD